jgi:beta-ureidopropionase / N-carbamoyl-L-amino-acid hydrolase
MLHINRERFIASLDQQAQIGATPDGGLSRLTLSDADREIRTWFEAQIRTSGLDYRMDGAGNQSGILRSTNPDAKTLLIGSHLDSVRNGGRFDGALGVMVGLEVVRSIQDAQLYLPFHLEVINFTDEEGTLRGLLGSTACVGKLTEDDLRRVRGGQEALDAALSSVGLSPDTVLTARRDPESLLGYLEVHIEQGSRLEEAGIDIGVVQSIVGVRSFWLAFTGEAAHAGTKPMAARRDAMWGASAFVQQARERIMQDYHPGVVNFGNIQLEPGAFNIVPREVRLALEFRHGDLQQLDAMQETLLDTAEQCAREYGLALTVQPVDDCPPAPMAETLIQTVERAADACGLSHTRLMSFAGHDAQSLAQVTPSVMFFVPSVGGISHNPLEYTVPNDCVHAAEVMMEAVQLLVSNFKSAVNV